MDWVKNRKISSYAILCALFFAYVVLLLLKSPAHVTWLYYFALSLTLLCPIALIALWLTSNDSFKALEETKWTALIMGFGVAIYAILSGVWAGNIVNEIFRVSPGELPVTVTVMTGIFFLNTVLLPLASLSYAILVFFSGIAFFVILSLWEGWKIFLKRVALLLLSALIVGTVLGGVLTIDHNKTHIAKLTAQYADFNEYHRCKNIWPVKVESVIFLPSGKVLASIPIEDSKIRDWNYKVLDCEWE